MNELDKLLERWPADQELTLHLVATLDAFFTNGAPHWGSSEGLAPDPDMPGYNVEEAQALREQSRAADPARAARYDQSKAEAEAIVAARAATGKVP